MSSVESYAGMDPTSVREQIGQYCLEIGNRKRVNFQTTIRLKYCRQHLHQVQYAAIHMPPIFVDRGSGAADLSDPRWGQTTPSTGTMVGL